MTWTQPRRSADLASGVSALPGLVSDPSVVSNPGLVRVVTPDAARGLASLEHWIQRHLDSPAILTPSDAARVKRMLG